MVLTEQIPETCPHRAVRTEGVMLAWRQAGCPGKKEEHREAETLVEWGEALKEAKAERGNKRLKSDPPELFLSSSGKRAEKIRQALSKGKAMLIL